MASENQENQSNKKSASTSIPTSAMPLVSPNALLHAHLKQVPPSRPSGRSVTDLKPVNLNTGSLTNSNGSSLVKIGSTTIVCGVRAEILSVSEIPTYRAAEKRYVDSSSRGLTREPSDDETPVDSLEDAQAIQLNHLLVPNLELATGCSPAHLANTAPSVEAQSISQRLLSLLHSSRIIRASDLSILYTPPSETEGLDPVAEIQPLLKGYWVLYIDMTCISYGGNIFDAAWFAMYAALLDTLIPKAWWDMDRSQIICLAELAEAWRLDLHGMPVPCSFGVFVPETRTAGKKSESWLLVDTDAFEEGICQEVGCVTADFDINGHGKILRIEKNGGDVVDVQQIKDIMSIVQRRWRQWKDVLDATAVAAR